MPSPSNNLLVEESVGMDDDDLLVSPPPPRAPPAAATAAGAGAAVSPDDEDLLVSPPPPRAPPPAGAAVSPSASMSNTNILPATTSEEEGEDDDGDGVGGIENKDIQRMHLELEDLLSDFKEQAADDGDDKGKDGNDGEEEDDVWTTLTPKNSSDRRATTGGSKSYGWDDHDSDGHDSDDDFDDELHQLAMSEQALREELEFAQDMSLLGSPGFQMPFESPQRTAEDAPEQITSTSDAVDTAPVDPDAALVGSANEKQNTSTEDEDLPRPVALEFSATPEVDDTESVVEKQDTEDQGPNETSQEPPIESEEQQQSPPTQEKPRAQTTTTSLKAPFTYSLQNHANSLKLRTEQQNGGWYYCDMTRFLLPDSNGRGRDTVKDYCLPVPFKKLKRLYSGLVYHNTVVNSAAVSANTSTNARHQQQHSASNTPTAVASVTAPTTPSDQVMQTPATPATKDLMASVVPPEDSDNSQTPTPNDTASKIPATPGLSFFSPPAGTARTQMPAPPGTAARDGTPPAPPPSAFRSPEPETRTQQQPNSSMMATRIKSQKPLPEEPLPFRTISIRVRPDVLCGAIMDAASRALEILPTGGNGGVAGTTTSLSSPVAAVPTIIAAAAAPTTTTATKSVMTSITTHVLKRQGGHLRGAVYYPNKGEDRPARAYVVDVQLCTQRNDDELQRRLIVRYYHIQDDPEALHELGNVIQQKRLEEKQQQQRQQQENKQSADGSVSNPESTTRQGVSSPRSEEEDCVAHEDIAANKHLRQSCSLIQRLMALNEQDDSNNDVTEQRRRQEATWLGLRPDKSFDSESSLQRAVGVHLEANFKLCPSVREENKRAGPTIRRLTLPALSKKDWAMMDISWELTSYIVDELDTRDCSYNTLSALRFGQFPCLPTLDVHYCSQLRRLSRENMIAHLLKSAKDLEDYASSAEYNCALCVKLLEPMLTVYGIPSMDLPKPKPLDDYPLDYTPPQLSCPPWGNVVMEALNKVAAKTPTGDIDASEAVGMVYRAFMTQDDEEQGARLGRKNSQIMDRLANLQTLQRSMVEKIRDSSVDSEKAADAASDFLKRSQEAVNYEKRGFPSHVRPEVPLIDIKISLGASTSGRCYVTSNQIQFVTTSIPMLGSTTTTLFDLSAVKFYVEQNPTPTLLNPFPNTMSLVIPSTREVAYSFRPAMNPDRLMAGLTVIQNFANEKTPSIYSPVGDHAKHAEDSAAGGGIVNEEVVDRGEEEQGSLTV